MNYYKDHCLLYCSRAKTVHCPNSISCYCTDDKPYFMLDESKLDAYERLDVALKRLWTLVLDAFAPLLDRVVDLLAFIRR